MRSLVAKFLHGQGYRVLSAARGSDAIQLAAEQSTSIDLLLSDVRLAEHEWPADLRETLGDHARTASLVHVRLYRKYHRAHGVQEGGFYFLQKPFSLKELARKVREALDQRRAPAREHE